MRYVFAVLLSCQLFKVVAAEPIPLKLALIGNRYIQCDRGAAYQV